MEAVKERNFPSGLQRGRLLSFFALYARGIPHVLGPNFVPFEALARDVMLEPDDSFPQVLVIEPSYESAPHDGSDQPNADHAPLPMAFGEEFLRDI